MNRQDEARPMRGMFDDARIYSTALSSNQIARLTLDTCEMYDPLIPWNQESATLPDISTNQSDGTITGSAYVFENGDFHGDFEDASSESVALDDWTLGTSAYTISCRINMSDDGSGSECLLGQTRASTWPHGFGICTYDVTGSDYVYATFEHSAGQEWHDNLYIDWDAESAWDEWHTVTATISDMGNGSGTAVGRIYLDGVFKMAYTNNSTTYENYKPFIAACDNGSGVATYQADVEIDDCLIYKRVLSDAEILAVHNRNPPADTFRHYNFTPPLSDLHAIAETWDTGYAPAMWDYERTPDKSGEGNDGTCSADTILTQERGGFIGDFDGTEKIVIPATEQIENLSAISLCAWVKMPDHSTAGEDIILDSWRAGAFALQLRYDSVVDRIEYGVGYNTSYAYLNANTNLEGNVWRHVVVMWDTVTDKMKLYVDGEKHTTEATYSATETIIDPADDDDIWMGQAEASDSDDFIGQMSGVRIYTSAISNDVATLHAAGRHAPRNVISTDNLVAFYDFTPASTNYLVGAWRGDRTGKGNGQAFTNIVDISGNGNDGTAVNSPTIEAAR